MENVDVFDDDSADESEDPSASNTEFIVQAFRELGYALGMRVFRSHEFSVPQTRIRVYFIAIRLDVHDLTASQADEMIERVMDTTDLFKGEPVSLHSLLLPNNNPRVEQELRRLSTEDDAVDKTPEQKWKPQHKALLESKGLSWMSLTTPQELEANPWFATLKRRSKEIIIFHGHLTPPPPDKKLCLLDHGQGINRARRMHNGMCKTVTPGMKAWIFSTGSSEEEADDKRGRQMIGFECLKLQAFPTTWVDHALPAYAPSESLLADLAGNAFTGTVFAAVYIALLSHLPPHAQQETVACADLMKFMF